MFYFVCMKVFLRHLENLKGPHRKVLGLFVVDQNVLLDEERGVDRLAKEVQLKNTPQRSVLWQSHRGKTFCLLIMFLWS